MSSYRLVSSRQYPAAVPSLYQDSGFLRIIVQDSREQLVIHPSYCAESTGWRPDRKYNTPSCTDQEQNYTMTMTAGDSFDLLERLVVGC